jgi:SAM-dependent methyltransferase
MKDPASFTGLMPGVRFLPEVVTPDGVGTTYRFQTRVAGLPICGSGRFTQVEANRHIRRETSIPIAGSFDYWFADEDGGTRVTIEHHPGRLWGVPVLGRLLADSYARNDQQVLALLKARLEPPAPPRPDLGGDVPQGLSGRVGVWLTPFFHGPMYPAAAAALRLQPDDDLLDVACGSGSFLATCAPRVRFTAGVDASDLAVSSARRHLAARIADGTAEIVLGDAAHLPWPDGRFSAVTCLGSLDLMPEPERVLSEMRRVLRSDGRAVFTMGSRFPDERARQKYAAQAWCWTEQELAEALRKAGFAEPLIRYHRWGGRSIQADLVNRFSRTTAGTDEYRLVRTAPAGTPT